MMTLMQTILATQVPQGSVALWWLGQNSFIAKSPLGIRVGIDLYLTDRCAERHPEINLRRRVPALIAPEELQLDVFATTHNHCDHTDPETIRRFHNRQRVLFVGPHPSCETFRSVGVPEQQMVPAWPGCTIQLGDVTLHGTFALPTDDSDLNHIGYVLEVAGGPRIYWTGDTSDHELLTSVSRYRPHVMIACINAGFNNLSHWEAARLASRIQPQVAIPCHWDLFPDNAADPEQFRAALRILAPQVRYVRLEHGQAWIYPDVS